MTDKTPTPWTLTDLRAGSRNTFAYPDWYQAARAAREALADPDSCEWPEEGEEGDISDGTTGKSLFVLMPDPSL